MPGNPSTDSNRHIVIQSLFFLVTHWSSNWHQNGTKIWSIGGVYSAVAGIGVAESMRLKFVLLGS